MKSKYLFYAVCVLALGCSGNDSASNDEPASKNVFDSQVQSIDRARAAQQQMQDVAERQRQLLENSER